MPGQLEGGHAPTCGRVQGFVSECHFHLSQSNEAAPGQQNSLSVKYCRGSRNGDALKISTEMKAFGQFLNHYWAYSFLFIW